MVAVEQASNAKKCGIQFQDRGRRGLDRSPTPHRRFRASAANRQGRSLVTKAALGG
jgi:hypothetical protein